MYKPGVNNFSGQVLDLILNNILRFPIPVELIRLDEDMPKSELISLLVLHKRGPIIMSELAQELAVPLSTSTGVADRLVKKGLVERDRSPEDRRIVQIRLTDEGARLAAQIQDRVSAFMDKVTSVLTEEERNLLLGLAAKVIKAFASLETDKASNSGIRRIPLE